MGNAGINLESLCDGEDWFKISYFIHFGTEVLI